MKEPNVLCQGLTPIPLPELSLPPTNAWERIIIAFSDYELKYWMTSKQTPKY